METLLKLGADPDYHAGQLVRGALSRELNVTTPRQLARMLNREYMLHWFINETTTVTQENEAAMSEPPMFINNLSATLRLRVKPSSVQATGPDVYKMNTDPRGYVCILSYCSFKDRPDLDLEGSRSDVNNLASVFGKMGYTGHAHFSLTAAQTKQVLTKVRDMEVLDHVGCAVFIISSHGIGNEKFLTNDMKRLATEWVCDLFKDSECPRLKNKPKLFIFDFCRSHYKEQLYRQASAVKCTRVKEPLQDIMCIYSNSGGFMSHTFNKNGTPFTRALCRTLVQHAHNKELGELYREFLVEYTKMVPATEPQLRNLGFTKKFYFNPVTTF
ncbi:caspase Dronc-like [Homarus americanus]|uniref:caspase Dronc-like n=1 Tax=Homarus americanus TaxID=6706 RepID=UPI001C4743E1|nr:caspase Dronc-like [Homarus americanus]